MSTAPEFFDIFKREDAIRDLATAQGHEIDQEAGVSEGLDNGAYVQAWVWVSFVNTPFDKEKDDEHDTE